MGKDYLTPFLATMLTIVFILGLLSNIFIAAVYSIDWLKRRPINDSDKIIYSLAVSRVCMKCLLILQTFAKFFHADLAFVFSVMLCEYCFFYTSLWLITLLSVFYFLKIANYKHALFLCMRRLISQRLMSFMAAVTLIAFCQAFLYMFVFYKDGHVSNSIQYLPAGNISNSRPLNIYDVMGNAVPFLIFSVASILLIISLCRHVKRMRGNDSSFTANRLSSYYVAIKSLAICFLIYALDNGTNIVIVICDYSLNILSTYILWEVLPNLHTGYLIYSTPKLRQRFSEIIHHVENCLIRSRVISSRLETVVQ